MNLIKTAIFGALGCLAWRAWQRQKAAAAPAILPETPRPAHGIIRLEPAADEAPTAAVSGAQSSPGFGAGARGTH